MPPFFAAPPPAHGHVRPQKPNCTGRKRSKKDPVCHDGGWLEPQANAGLQVGLCQQLYSINQGSEAHARGAHGRSQAGTG